MKKFIGLAVVFALITAGTAWAITENQAMVAPVLEQLKLEAVPSKVIGGPQTYKITNETIELLKEAKKEGKHIVLKPSGEIEFVAKKKKK